MQSATRVTSLRSGAVDAVPAWARTSGLAAERRWRRVTQPARVLPDFVLIGAQKGGTTSLYNYLSTHPAVARAATKEVHYFDLNHARGDGWYRAHFPTRGQMARLRRRSGLEPVTGEATPYYLFHPQAPRRAHDLLPDAKLLVLLREPVERALSHHTHEVADGYETLGFAEAIDAEPRRLAGGLGFNHLHYSYLARGRYAEQLEAWFEYFPRERFLIADSRELFESPAALVARMFAFLGLPDHELSRHGVWGARPHPNVEPELRRRLDDYFAPHNERLFALLGRPFEWGLK